MVRLGCSPKVCGLTAPCCSELSCADGCCAWPAMWTAACYVLSQNHSYSSRQAHSGLILGRPTSPALPCGASKPHMSLSALRPPPQALTWPDISPASRDIFRPELSK